MDISFVEEKKISNTGKFNFDEASLNALMDIRANLLVMKDTIPL